jgi:Raf kinase inhibitor-like YbhB/YbcL family protein
MRSVAARLVRRRRSAQNRCVPGRGWRHLASALLLGSGMVLASCAPAAPSEVGSMANLQVSSTAFVDGGTIPGRYTCDGRDVSPPLAWSGLPPGTQAVAVIVTDPDARGFVHWAATDIPPAGTPAADASATESALTAGALAEGASTANGGTAAGVEGRNDFGRVGWGGPCPPAGSHRYVFTVYALSRPAGPTAGFSADQLRQRLGPLTLAQGTLTASYRRGG